MGNCLKSDLPCLNLLQNVCGSKRKKTEMQTEAHYRIHKREMKGKFSTWDLVFVDVRKA